MPSVSTQQNRFVHAKAAEGVAWAEKWVREQHGHPVPNVKYARKKKPKRAKRASR